MIYSLNSSLKKPIERIPHGCASTICSRFRVLLALGSVALGVGPATAAVAYGTINNFDTVNDTGVECHGFEIEIEDLHSRDITYTYNWNHYGTPRITEDTTNPLHPKVRIRYESAKNPDGTWAAYTAIPSGPIAPTDGHQFTDPTVNFGGEHFGAGYFGTPSAVSYHWLVDNGAGVLVLGPAVNVATPTFSYVPPAQGAPAQVQAAIKPPPQPQLKEFGPASWVKEIRTTSHNSQEIELRNLVSDDPHSSDDKNWRNGEPDEVEVEWQILQTDFKKADGGKNGKLEAAPEDLNDGDEIITRRYEFFKYVGPLDPENGEALAEKVGPDGIHGMGEYANTVVVGDFVGSQMSAYDNELPVGLIEHLPDGEMGVPYATRTMVIAGVAFSAERTGALPMGMTFDVATGQLSGTPNESGIFTFHLRVAATNHLAQAKTYTFAIAAAGEELPPHTTVDTIAAPLDSGTTTGSGLYLKDSTTTVIALPETGFGFKNWMENGKIVSLFPRYTFTNIVNHSLVANFVPMPSLTFSIPQPGTLAVAWPTNELGVVLQQNSSLATPGWVAVPDPVTVVGTNNLVTLSPLEGIRFFRLMRP